jgi:hypothetical protein
MLNYIRYIDYYLNKELYKTYKYDFKFATSASRDPAVWLGGWGGGCRRSLATTFSRQHYSEKEGN